ncbi:response regulator transcription factor [Pseudomonas chlororaphis]|uniref:response regulator transcription factor n=1 Tax=Pseudomonas chlororaphis TaxID=587753 RepID=UPI000ABDA4AF|nr:response regulator transcription factor [Pseudomonas chlororaphis]
MKRIKNTSSELSPESDDRILVADDNAVMRKKLVMELTNNAFTVVGQARSGVEALRLAQRDNPSLMLLDLDMPLMEGLSTLRRLQEVCPNLPVLVYSMLNASVYSYRCLRLGARGYIRKSDGLSLIVSAVSQVLQGQMLFLSHPTGEASDELSDDEIIVLRCLVRGGNIDSIAAALMISAAEAAQLHQRLNAKLSLFTHQELIHFGKGLTLS